MKNRKNIRKLEILITDAKIKKQGIITSKIEKIKKTFFQIDYKHQDIYINKKMFEKLIKNSSELDNENLNPLTSDKLVKIQHNNPKEELICI